LFQVKAQDQSQIRRSTLIINLIFDWEEPFGGVKTLRLSTHQHQQTQLISLSPNGKNISEREEILAVALLLWTVAEPPQSIIYGINI
jgi:hypothetical protein